MNIIAATALAVLTVISGYHISGKAKTSAQADVRLAEPDVTEIRRPVKALVTHTAKPTKIQVTAEGTSDGRVWVTIRPPAMPKADIQTDVHTDAEVRAKPLETGLGSSLNVKLRL